jgi:CheY-like chemotaxis protein
LYTPLVEDERRLVQVMRKVLEEEGHTADVAYDGEDGLAMAMEGSHDVIVLDVLLPASTVSRSALTVPRPVLHSKRRVWLCFAIDRGLSSRKLVAAAADVPLT